MDRLWAPWRLEYVKSNAGKTLGDFIERADRSTDDRDNLVILRTDYSIVILNRFPYNNGHLLIAPRRQVAELEDLTDGELLDCQKTLLTILRALKKLFRPEGFNIGLNLGKVAGAGLPEHLHWHIVPRWNGDVNFMTVTGDTQILVQSLDQLWIELRRELGLPAE